MCFVWLKYVEVTPASVHDLAALRNTLEKTAAADTCILDKAYADAELSEQMFKNDCLLLTPRKDKKDGSCFQTKRTGIQ
jgi:IS5 family transposase